MTEKSLEVGELIAGRVVAQGLYLVDAKGLARASCQLENGQAVQTLYDEKGRVRARLGLNPDGTPSLSLTDLGGQMRAQMYLKPNGDPRIGLADGGGRLRTKIYFDEGSEPSIGLAGVDGKPLVHIGETDAGMGITVNGPDGKARLRFVVDELGKVVVTVLDESGQITWQPPAR